ncbi:MAG TPA: hypothetical protein VN281_03740 [Verrucomicrobiae bacterium]|nr:hypothetical protein [Verrucomicrobiae bacterium]
MNEPNSNPLIKQPRAPSERPRTPSQREFKSVEEMLRHDASLTSVPRAVQGRIEKSVARGAKPRSWWKRIFRGEW